MKTTYLAFAFSFLLTAFPSFGIITEAQIVVSDTSPSTGDTIPEINNINIENGTGNENNDLGEKQRKIVRAFGFNTENDFFSGFLGYKNEDKDYSGGFKFEFFTDYFTHGILPFFMNRKDPKNIGININSFYIQGLGFTPNREAFDKLEPVKDQRPYSSLLVFGKRRIAFFETIPFLEINRPFLIQSDLYIGKIGGKINGEVQNWLHKNVTDSDLVLGWNNQIANGGRFAYNYNVSASIDFSKKSKSAKLISTPHLSYGNIHKNVGLKIALSNIDLANIPTQTSIGSAQNSGQDAKQANIKPKLINYEIYVKPIWVMHNSLLMGMPIKRYDNSIYIIPKSDVLNFIDFGGKIYFNYNPYDNKCKKTTNWKAKEMRRSSIYLEVVRRGKEFSYGPTHIFGGFGILIYNQ